jgi:hypothetical protein
LGTFISLPGLHCLFGSLFLGAPLCLALFFGLAHHLGPS